MKFRFSFALFLICLSPVLFSSCATIEGEPFVFEGQTINIRVDRKFVDEDSPLDNQIIFRNIGTQVVTFDYTVADRPGVPHIDMFGPNSGLIENLYPGAEIKVSNPANLKEVYASLGTVVYGKKTPEEIARIYNLSSPELASAGSAVDLTL